MNTSDIFQQFLENLEIKNNDEIDNRFRSMTKRLNRTFHQNESESSNSKQVGSVGRKTAVNGVSDLDMLFVLPSSDFNRYDQYEGNGQSALLQDVRASLKETYPNTDIRGDCQVVVVSFNNYVVEVCPAFLQDDGSYKYPDSSNGGQWKKTNPDPEILECDDFDIKTNSNFKNLAKMARAWKNKQGVKIGGLLLDTLCYEFLLSDESHQRTSFANYHFLCRDFFKYLKELSPERKFWLAPGSNQQVYKKKSNFIKKAKKAYDNILQAIEKKQESNVYVYWRKVFGYPFPFPIAVRESYLNYTPDEQYIENLVPVDIKNYLRINCEVSQAGFRTELLRNLVGMLRVNKRLVFYIEETDVAPPYCVKWKIKNEGEIAKRKNHFRGQILADGGYEKREENSKFAGPHFVECYLIKDNICVARDRIDVPISGIMN